LGGQQQQKALQDIVTLKQVAHIAALSSHLMSADGDSAWTERSRDVAVKSAMSEVSQLAEDLKQKI